MRFLAADVPEIRRVVNHNLTVGEDFSLIACKKDYGTHRCRNSRRYRHDLRPHTADGVVEHKPCRHIPSGRADIKGNRLAAFAVKEHKLLYDALYRVCVHLVGEEESSLLGVEQVVRPQWFVSSCRLSYVVVTHIIAHPFFFI